MPEDPAKGEYDEPFLASKSCIFEPAFNKVPPMAITLSLGPLAPVCKSYLTLGNIYITMSQEYMT
jgi:hypothetical protein